MLRTKVELVMLAKGMVEGKLGRTPEKTVTVDIALLCC